MNLDFINLRKISGGDAALESELFRVFFESSKECVETMRQNMGRSGAEEWRMQAHSLRNISLAIGADDLAGLCREAQDNFLTTTIQKQSMLSAIELALSYIDQELREI
jgi:HPt (histidine-containing phosphotransfer) domain-containing protein